MISQDDIDAFEEDDKKLTDVLDRYRRGTTKHRRIFANEEDAVLNMAMHYRERCFQLVRELQRLGSESMSSWEDPKYQRRSKTL